MTETEKAVVLRPPFVVPNQYYAATGEFLFSFRMS